MIGRTAIRKRLERALGLRIYSVPPRGADIFFDLGRALPGLEVKNVFDIGANVGQSAVDFLTAFPTARISCFEPVSTTFEELRRNVGHNPNVELCQVAFGSSPRTENMTLAGPSSMFRLSSIEPTDERNSSEAPQEAVRVATLDGFCEDNGVDHVNYLKIDTEGFELEVLKGAEILLGRASFDVIQAEVGMSLTNKWHVPLNEVVEHLSQTGYRLFSITEQHPSFTPAGPLSRSG